MRTLVKIVVAALFAFVSCGTAEAQKTPQRFATASIGGHVVGFLAQGDGGCITYLRVKPDADQYAPILTVWIPWNVLPPSIGELCKGVSVGDYLRVEATLDGWSCWPDFCGRPWTTAVLMHRRAGELLWQGRR